MIKVYIVFIKYGFGGVKCFQKRENAERFAQSVNEVVEEEYASPKEYYHMDFDDPLEEY